MSRFEQEINRILQRFPSLKVKIKRVYQRGMYLISPKIKSVGNISCLTPKDEYEYFFGYYDKCPWDITGRYILCNRVNNAYEKPDNSSVAELVIIDTKDNNRIRVIAKTNCWNVQQGCMLQWLGPDYRERIIYNDFRDGHYCSVVLNIFSNEERVFSKPVYSISRDGKFALSLDFARLHRLRPGYGYCNEKELTEKEKCPTATCIWKLNLENGNIDSLFSYKDFASFHPRKEMENAEHKINHIMISPNGSRFMVLHRWFVGDRKYTRLLTASCDGGDIYNLLDDDFVSHCCWKNENTILTFAEKKGIGRGYFLLKDQTGQFEHICPSMVCDGHPTYNCNNLIVTDSYPDRRRVSNIYVFEESNGKPDVVARVFAPFRYDNDVRCDLHPRWSHDGKSICFDSVFEGKRALYIVKLGRDKI